MTLERIWSRKSDEELVAASNALVEYTDEGQQAIVAELNRRRESGLLSDVDSGGQPSIANDAATEADGEANLPRGVLRRLWRGDVSLAVTYWVWGVSGNVAAVIVLLLAESMQRRWIALPMAVLQLAYYVFTFVAIWRSAGKYAGKRVWADLARFVLVLGLFNSLVRLFGR